jgi:hypothetical protein
MSRLLKPLHIDDPGLLIEIITEVVDEIQKGAVVLDTCIGDNESGHIDLIAADRDKKGMLFFINVSGQEIDFLRSFKCLLWYQENREILQKLYSGIIDLSFPPSLVFISPCYSHGIQKVLLNLKEGQVTLLKYVCFQDGEQIKIFLENIADIPGDKNDPSRDKADTLRDKADGTNRDDGEKQGAGVFPQTSPETAPQMTKPANQPQRPAIDLKKFRQEIGIDLSNISDDELRDLIE